MYSIRKYFLHACKCLFIALSFGTGHLQGQISPVTWGFDSNFMVPGYLEANKNMEINSGNSSTSPEEFRGFMEFDLTATPSASLQLPVFLNLRVKRNVNPISFQLYGYVGDGVVSRSDFSAGDALISEFVVASAGELSFDVTTFVRTSLDNDNKLLGFNIRPTVSGGFPKDTTWQFYDVGLGEVGAFGNGGNFDTLPEPTSIQLLLTSMFMSIIHYRCLRAC